MLCCMRISLNPLRRPAPPRAQYGSGGTCPAARHHQIHHINNSQQLLLKSPPLFPLMPRAPVAAGGGWCGIAQTPLSISSETASLLAPCPIRNFTRPGVCQETARCRLPSCLGQSCYTSAPRRRGRVPSRTQRGCALVVVILRRERGLSGQGTGHRDATSERQILSHRSTS